MRQVITLTLLCSMALGCQGLQFGQAARLPVRVLKISDWAYKDRQLTLNVFLDKPADLLQKPYTFVVDYKINGNEIAISGVATLSSSPGIGLNNYLTIPNLNEGKYHLIDGTSNSDLGEVDTAQKSGGS